MNFRLFDVLQLASRTSDYLRFFSFFWLMCFRLFDVLQLFPRTSDCLMYFSLFWLTFFRLFDVIKIDVLPIVWCTSACFMYFGLFDVLQLVSRTSDCLMYFRLFGVTLACLMSCSLLKILQSYASPKIDIIIVIQTHHEGFLRPTIHRLTAHCTLIISLPVRNHTQGTGRILLEAKTVLSRKWNKIFPIELQRSVGWPYWWGRRIV